MSKHNIDWNTIRSEYVSGGISQRDIAKKYGISYNTLKKRAGIEAWADQRKETYDKSVAIAQQKTVESATKSAEIAARIREKLLRKLEREIDALPDKIGSNYHEGQTALEYGKDGKSRKPTKTQDVYRDYRLKELSSAWKDLTDGLPMDDSTGSQVTVIIDV